MDMIPSKHALTITIRETVERLSPTIAAASPDRPNAAQVRVWETWPTLGRIGRHCIASVL